MALALPAEVGYPQACRDQTRGWGVELLPFVHSIALPPGPAGLFEIAASASVEARDSREAEALAGDHLLSPCVSPAAKSASL